MSMNTIATRCNLQESTKKLQYDITTENVKKYLDSKFEFINKGLKNKNVPNVNDIDVNIRTLKIGKNFLPFIVVLPDDVLDRASFDPNTPSVFRPEDDDDAVRLKPYYYHFLANYMYSKEDIGYFGSSSWRRAAGNPPAGNIRVLKKYARPAIETVPESNGQKTTMVLVILDPIKIFHEMLIDNNNPKQRFTTFVTEMQSVGEGSYNFTVSREVIKKNKNDGKQIEDLINALKRDAIGRN